MKQAQEFVKQTMVESQKNEQQQCVDHTSVLNMIQTSIWKYNNDNGMYDHLSDGRAVVVYGDEWTITSYAPLPTDDNNDYTYERLTLGDYQSYIPEDWLRILPDGWEDTDVTFIQKFLSTDPREHLPTSVWHSMPLPLMRLLSPPGNSIAIPKPPETIMSKNNHLGSCWAMAGSNGKITLRLRKQMTTIKSVTVDHYPGIPSAHQESYADNINQSAPRFIKVIGYPPCADEDRDALDCIKLGFDKMKPLDLGSFEYNPVPTIDDPFEDYGNASKPRRSSQTFKLRPKPGTDVDDMMYDNEDVMHEDDADDDNDDDDNEKGKIKEDGMFGGGSCSATKPSCGSEVIGEDEEESENIMEALTIASISFIIDENWGNEDFTCIYRIRVHGST